MTRNPGTCVVFGGTGFIGTHFSRYLLANGIADHVVLADIRPPEAGAWSEAAQDLCRSGQARYVRVDVRQALRHEELPDRVGLVVNLAAVHREPGHEPREYFETNLLGAEHVCAWAEAVGCGRMIFTSSISPYGPTEDERDERSLPLPATPYGASKLAAEKIHLAWQRGGQDRRLLIARPGVVFGPAEGGNLTRLIRALLGRYFCYMGNRRTRKAGGYVKELCHALVWMMERQERRDEPVALFNFTMDPPPTVEEYVETVCRVAGVERVVPAVPYRVLLGASYVIEAASRPLGIHQPISPVRIRKLVRSNNIVPGSLRQAKYPYQYTLEQALADWLRERPSDWSRSGDGIVPEPLTPATSRSRAAA